MLPPSLSSPRLVVAPKPYADIHLARQVLANARAALDRAVADLPMNDGNETMAPPQLLPLLMRAVQARQHLSTLETRGDGDV